MLLDNNFVSDRRVDREAASLGAAGYKVVVCALQSQGLAEFEERNGYEVHRIIPPAVMRPLRRGHRETEARLCKTLTAYAFRILHCHDFHLLPVAATLKATLPALTLVYDSHEYLRGWPFYRESRGPWNLLKAWLVWNAMVVREKRAMRQVDVLIAPSRGIGDRLVKTHGLQGIPQFTVRNIPVMPRSGIREDLRLALGLSPESRILVHSGSIYHSEKFTERMLTSLQKFGPMVLLYIGNRAKHDAFKAHFHGHPLAERIAFRTYDEQRLHSDLLQCTLGLAITNIRYEAHRIGSSNRVMEYSQAGLPILGTEQSTHRTLKAGFGHVELFDPRNMKTFEAALHTILDNEEEYGRCAARAAGQLCWESEFQPVLAEYRHITGR